MFSRHNEQNEQFMKFFIAWCSVDVDEDDGHKFAEISYTVPTEHLCTCFYLFYG